MTAALLTALFFTVALLVITAYFIMGSVPLLILKHDTPMDSRFVRGFFNAYYRAAPVAALAAGACYALSGRPAFAAGAVGLALLAELLRRLFMPRMDALVGRMQGGDARCVAAFRRLHATVIAVNVLQLAVTVGSLAVVSIQLK